MSIGILNTIGVLIIILLIGKILGIICTIFAKLCEAAKTWEEEEKRNNEIKELEHNRINYKETRMGFVKGSL